MTNRPAANERLGHLLHLDGRLHPRVDALLLQRILQREAINDGREHAHVIGGYPVHVFRLLRHATEEVPSAHDDGQLHAQLMNVGQLRRHFMNARGVDAKALVRRQSFTGNLEKNSFEGRGWSRHE